MTENIKTMRWGEIENSTTISHIACHRMAGGMSTRLHTHDFAELFWGISGHATHEIGGKVFPIGQQELFFIHPDDVHNISIANGGKYIFTNLAFRPDGLYDLSRRYNSSILEQWATEGHVPVKYHLPAPLFHWLNERVKDVFKHRESRLVLDAFLINLIYELEKQHFQPLAENCPEWLSHACNEVLKPGNFRYGPVAFSRLTGYTQEYVARELKKYTGKTPTEIVNEARLQHAATLLMTTSDSINDISEACGFDSLSYFFAAFKRQFGTTPRRYRSRNLVFNKTH